MTVLLLRLAGPLQAWGDSSRFTRRETRHAPTKSGVLGLLAAADGRRRTDEIEDLAHLAFGVRIDQPGTVQKDFQTAINWETGAVMPLSHRYYLADAVFVAGVEGDRSLLEALAAKVQEPTFPLYLGRRSCPVSGQVFLGLSEEPLATALEQHPWQASRWHRRRQPREVELEIHLDASAVEGRAAPVPVETRRDLPLSFDPRRREYGWRDVAHLVTTVENEDGWAPREGSEWFDAVLEAQEA